MTRFKKITSLLIVIATVLAIFSSIPSYSADAVGTTTPFHKWKQYDPQWKDVYIGNNTIGNIGCYVTSAAMLIVYGGLRTEANFDPATLVSELKEVGGFSGNLIYKGKINKAVAGFDYCSEVLLGKTKEEKTDTIEYYLDKGYYIIAGVRNLGHYVAIREVKNGVVYMMDPGSESEVLFDYYATSGVTKIFLYTSTGKKVTIDENGGTVTTPPLQNSYAIGIYKTTDALNLREKPTTASTALTIIPEGTEVSVTQTDGNWGKVEFEGKTGYICLDYASLVSEFKDPSNLSSEDPSESEPSSEEPSSEEPSSEEPSSEEPSSEEPSSEEPSSEEPSSEEPSSEEPSSEEPSSEEPSSEEPSSEDTSSEDDTSSEAPSEYVPGRYKMTGSVYLRKGPSSSYSSLTVIPKGTEIEVTEINGKWGKTTYGGYEGYCGLAYSKLIEAFEEEKKEIPVVETINGGTTTKDGEEKDYYKGNYKTKSNLNLRANASTSGSKLVIIPIGTQIKVTEVKNGWGKTVYDGQTGWCSLEYCQYENAYVEKTELSTDGIIATLYEKADLSFISVNTYYSDGSVILNRNGIEVSYVIPTTLGTVTATAKFEGKEYTFKILYVDNCTVKAENNFNFVIVKYKTESTDIFGVSTEMKTGLTCEIDGVEFTVIVSGDVDSTGDLTTTDYLKIKQAFLDPSSLDGISIHAADYDGDGSISATDYLSLKAFLVASK